MKKSLISLAAILAVASIPVLAQEKPGAPAGASVAAPAARPPGTLSPEQIADTNALRALTAQASTLPGERVVLKLSGVQVFGVTAMAADKQGNIYVLHRPKEADESSKADPVVVVDRNGKLLRSWGRDMYTIPHGIKVDPQGNVWTIDANTSVVRKFSPDGKQLLQIDVGGIPDPKRAFCGATDVAFASSGAVFISDGYCNGRVLEYTTDGKKVKEFGARGTERGQFRNAHGIAMGLDGTVYVADRENGRLQWFSVDGKFLGEKKFGGQLFSVAIGAKGQVYVGTQPRDVPYGTDAHVFQINPATGQIIGKVAVAAHQLSVAPDGTVLPGTRTGEVVLFRPRG